MIFDIPNNVNHILNVLMDNSYEAFIVGGCVRDIILNKVPEDWDITTSAKPDDIKRLFKRTIDTGIEHGTVTVLLDNDKFEVTTYRLDGEYEDNRHPKQVAFTSSLKEDLRRRDFTINAMAYNEKQGLIDLYGGIEDLKNKIVTCVGVATERLEEDALRILRAIRFSAQLGFDIEKNTLDAIKNRVSLLKHISAERINVELSKLLVSDNPDRIRLAYELGITREVLPEFDKMMLTRQNNKHHMYNVGDHTIKALRIVGNIKSDRIFTAKEKLILRWTILLHDVEKPNTLTTDQYGNDHFYGHNEKGAETAKKILKRLRFDNETLDTVVRLIKHHTYRYKLDARNMRKAVSKIGKKYMELLFEVNYADNMAKNEKYIDEMIADLDQAERLYREIIDKNECTDLKSLKITGKDLVDSGFKQGKVIGNTLNTLLGMVINEPNLNNKETLLNLAKEIKN
ncbi:MAG TPA: CCA tRNA nucleotidyltransferase [Clostridiales bacterium]|nr:CCA tRNA nucleotidyltransferase [Clostridiales bacterium]